MGLAQVGKALHGVRAALRRVLTVVLPDPFGGGIELYLQPVLARFQDAPHLKLEGAVHVLHMGQQHTVQADIRHRVHAFKAEHLGGAVQNTFLWNKAGCVEKVLLHQGQGRILVVPVVGVLHFPRCQQVRVHRTGHLGRDCLCQAGHLQAPALVQYLGNHSHRSSHHRLLSKQDCFIISSPP